MYSTTPKQVDYLGGGYVIRNGPHYMPGIFDQKSTAVSALCLPRAVLADLNASRCCGAYAGFITQDDINNYWLSLCQDG